MSVSYAQGQDGGITSTDLPPETDNRVEIRNVIARIDTASDRLGEFFIKDTNNNGPFTDKVYNLGGTATNAPLDPAVTIQGASVVQPPQLPLA